MQSVAHEPGRRNLERDVSFDRIALVQRDVGGPGALERVLFALGGRRHQRTSRSHQAKHCRQRGLARVGVCQCGGHERHGRALAEVTQRLVGLCHLESDARKAIWIVLQWSHHPIARRQQPRDDRLVDAILQPIGGDTQSLWRPN